MSAGDRVSRFEWERALRAAPEVTGVQLLVLLALATYADLDGRNVKPSQATLAEATGLSDRSVRRHLAAAVQDDWLTVTSRGHRRGDGTAAPSAYELTRPQPATPDRLTDASTGHARPVEDVSTGQTERLNRPPLTAQPATGGHQPVPRPKRDNPPAPQPLDDVASQCLAVLREGWERDGIEVDLATAQRCAQRAAVDPTTKTSPAGRCRVPEYRERLLRQARAQEERLQRSQQLEDRCEEWRRLLAAAGPAGDAALAEARFILGKPNPAEHELLRAAVQELPRLREAS